MNLKASFFLFLWITSFSFGQSLFIDSLYGYQLYFPANWTSEFTDTLGVNFRDTTLDPSIGQAFLGIILFDLTPAEKLDPEEWVREQYIAMKIDIDSAQEYLSVLLFTDSSHTLQIDGRWAPDICAFFFDNTENYRFMEYVTYTHANGYGYELFAFGDSLTMTQNLSTYIGLLRSVQFFSPVVASVKQPFDRVPLKFRNSGLTPAFIGSAFDIRGRVRHPELGISNNPSIIILKEPGRKFLIGP